MLTNIQNSKDKTAKWEQTEVWGMFPLMKINAYCKRVMQFVQGGPEVVVQQSPEGGSQVFNKRQKQYSTRENHNFHVLQKNIVLIFLKTVQKNK